MRGAWNHNSHYYGLLLDAVPDGCRSALDVGCGDGTLCRLLTGRSRRVTGIDSSGEMIARARSLSGDHRRVDYVCGDFLTTPLTDRYDFVCAVAALHHMPLAEALAKMKELLAPGGVLAIVGLAKSRSIRDFAVDALAIPAARVYHLTRGGWEPGAPLADPETSYAEVGEVAARMLPGAAWRRRLLFRYSLIWRAPAEPAPPAGQGPAD